jgi:hypothetical protein
MDLSNSGNWKHRSSALNSLARLKGLGPHDEEHLEQRVVAALEDGGEVFYVKKDAAFVAGNREYLDLVPQLVGCLDHSHYSVRFAVAEALRQLSAAPSSSSGEPPGRTPAAPVSPAPISRASAAQQPHDRVILNALRSALSGLTTEGFIAAIYAGSDLPAEGKLDLLEAGLGTSHSGDLHGAIALARLASTCKPERPAEKKRLEGLTARLPQDSWEVKAILKR